jgi:hypothetical protein
MYLQSSFQCIAAAYSLLRTSSSTIATTSKGYVVWCRLDLQTIRRLVAGIHHRVCTSPTITGQSQSHGSSSSSKPKFQTRLIACLEGCERCAEATLGGSGAHDLALSEEAISASAPLSTRVPCSECKSMPLITAGYESTRRWPISHPMPISHFFRQALERPKPVDRLREADRGQSSSCSSMWLVETNCREEAGTRTTSRLITLAAT